MTGPADKSFKFQVANAVCSLFEPGLATIAAIVSPSRLIETEEIFGSLAKSSAGIGLAVICAKAENGVSAITRKMTAHMRSRIMGCPLR
ncbi:MAG: hypothetical protein BroJett013_20720 [Alphaproteobacteria bacterium]|nr:MAG: hypothetical protein BroJett013_20720 [Alphaproteobacteria bacterium]